MNGLAQPGEYRNTNEAYAMYTQPTRTKGRTAGGIIATQNVNHLPYAPASNAGSSAYNPSTAPESNSSGTRSDYQASPPEERVQYNEEPWRALPPLPRTVSYSGSERPEEFGQSPQKENPALVPAPASSGSDLRLPITPLTAQELAISRMRVPDRPQDWGPIHEEDLDTLTLPPNYQQATEPFQPPAPSSGESSDPFHSPS